MMGASYKSSATDDDALFEEAIQGAVPLSNRDRIGPPEVVSAPRLRGAEEASNVLSESDGERISVRLPQIPRKRLRDAGRLPLPESATVDLHGLRAEIARGRMIRFIEDCQRRDEAIARIIIGRGHHSAGGRSVLRGVASETLRDLMPATVLAFGSSAAKHGGAGSITVLLRRQKEKSP